MTIIAIVVILAIALVAVLAYLGARRRRTHELQSRFGDEYTRVVSEKGDQRSAEAELVEREKRREKLEIRPLSSESEARYADSWRGVQARFVDAPSESIRDAHSLVIETMRERGYPTDDFEQRAADISVDHPDVVENYRAAHAIADRNDRGEASTEDLRQAMVHYRALFKRLLSGSEDGRAVEVEQR
jgi:hypothetical protein